MKYLKCNKCGWIHFAMSAVDAKFADISKCFKCGNSYKNFSPSEDPPLGVTIQPILEEEK